MTPQARTEHIGGDGLLANADDMHARLKGALAGSEAVTLDLSGLGAVDLSFVQMMVSASLTAERASRPLTLTGLSPALRATFERAGVGIDPTLGRITRG